MSFPFFIALYFILSSLQWGLVDSLVGSRTLRSDPVDHQQNMLKALQWPSARNRLSFQRFVTRKDATADANATPRAWQCHGQSQDDMVERLHQAGIVKSKAVLDVMRLVDRRNFVPSEWKPRGSIENEVKTPIAYLDRPIGIESNQTISAPHMHAMALELLLPSIEENGPKNARPVHILDVGCGSGYLTACFGRLFHGRGILGGKICSFPGKVWGIDIHPELLRFTERNLQRQDGDLLQSRTVALAHGNGWDGLQSEAPFDAIHVGAAASELPTELAVQLSLNGVLVVPVGPSNGIQALLKVKRVGTTSTAKFVWKDFFVEKISAVRYVPLIEGPM